MLKTKSLSWASGGFLFQYTLPVAKGKNVTCFSLSNLSLPPADTATCLPAWRLQCHWLFMFGGANVIGAIWHWWEGNVCDSSGLAKRSVPILRPQRNKSHAAQHHFGIKGMTFYHSMEWGITRVNKWFIIQTKALLRVKGGPTKESRSEPGLFQRNHKP